MPWRPADGDVIVVHDVPLLAENRRAGGFDLVIVVDVPPELQLERLVGQRGMTPDQARARMAAQASREQRLAVADLVIDNSGSLEDLDRRVAEVWADLQHRLPIDRLADIEWRPVPSRRPASEPEPALTGFGRYAGPATLILSSLADGAKHGYALTKDIEAFAGVRLAPGTLYEALGRLEGAGADRAGRE